MADQTETRIIAPLTLGLLAIAASADRADAFSQIQTPEGQTQSRDGILAVPLPPLPGQPEPAPAAADEPRPSGERQDELDQRPLAVHYGEDALPRPVADLRRRLIEIARSGDIEALRPFLETGANATALSPIPVEGDPIAFLKESSGDGEGAEILAILIEILSAGHVHLDPGTPEEIFVWPYFAQVSIDDLDRRQMVELFEIVTAGDFEAMREFGAYHFYRAGISPEGRLEFFLAGD